MFRKYRNRLTDLEARLTRLERKTGIGPALDLSLMTNRDLENCNEEILKGELARRRAQVGPGRGSGP